jgi:large subunit ribosomal protein L5e
MGEHIADYMREMEEDDEENFKRHFSLYLADEVTADELEEVYEKVHASIREDPSRVAVAKFTNVDKSFRKPIKKTYEQRKADSNAKKAQLNGGDADEDEEDDE